MVLEHVAQHADAVIKTRAMSNADCLSHCDLHMVNVGAIPDRLEDGVGKAGEQNILHSFLAEIMVNAIDLVFVECFVDLLIQSDCGCQVCAERFFKHHAPPASVLMQLTCCIKIINDDGENRRRKRHVVHAVRVAIFHLGQGIG